MPGRSLNCRRTSVMTDDAALRTAVIASDENQNTSIAPSRPPTNTTGFARSTLQRLARVVAHLVEVRREEQERRERRRADRVALRERLRRVADGVEPIGLLAHRLGLARHLDDAAGVVGDRAEHVHREDVAGRAEHAHRRDGGAEQAADRLRRHRSPDRSSGRACSSR